MKKYRLIKVLQFDNSKTTCFPLGVESFYRIELEDIATGVKKVVSLTDAQAYKREILGCYEYAGDRYCLSVVDRLLWKLLDIVDLKDIDYINTDIHKISSWTTNLGRFDTYEDKIIFNVKRGIRFMDTAFVSDGVCVNLYEFINMIIQLDKSGVEEYSPIYIIAPNQVKKQLIYDERLLRFYVKSRVLK